MAEQCGITSKLNAHPSIALGSSEVTLMELTAAYAVIATGRKVMPAAYTLIRDKKGEVLERLVPSHQEVLSADIVEKMRVLLRATIESGIAGMARAVPRTVYGKTGTTNDYSDAWFVGFDDRLALGVWVGRDDHTPGIEETVRTALPHGRIHETGEVLSPTFIFFKVNSAYSPTSFGCFRKLWHIRWYWCCMLYMCLYL
jgi:penicillin-binding protein 1A